MFKKYQCRYFDSRGRPLKPPCSQGNSCRFVHPEDFNWPGLKPVDKRISFVSSPPRGTIGSRAWGQTKVSPKTKSSPEYHHERRSAPLVSQDDLFQQCKIEATETTRENHGQTRRNYDVDQDQNSTRCREYYSRNANKSASRSHNTQGYLSVEQPSGTRLAENASNSYRSWKISTNKNSKLNFSSIDAKNRISLSSSPSSTGRCNKNVSLSSEYNSFIPAGGVASQEIDRAKERASRVLDLFRELSRLCHQATQDLGDQAKEEKKLKAYTELESTLSKVSGTATKPIMPALADVLLKHAQCKQRVDDNFKSMAKVWAEAFETFLAEISSTLDERLEVTMRTIRQETENALDATGSSRNLKRQRSENFRSTPSAEEGSENNGVKENEASFFTRDNDTMRERKRRRFDAVGLSSSESVLVTQTKHGPQRGVQSEIQDILSQMKMKIDEQAQSIQKLAKENNKLKASLHQQGPNDVSNTSGHSPPCFLALQVPRGGRTKIARSADDMQTNGCRD